jgi:hypothetical protein
MLIFCGRYSPNLGLGLPPLNSPFHFGFFLDLRQSVGLLGIQIHDPGFRANEDSTCLRPLGYRDRLYMLILDTIIVIKTRFLLNLNDGT